MTSFFPGVWNSRGRVSFSLQSGARYELVDGDIRRAFSKYGCVREVRLSLKVQERTGRLCW